MKKTILAAVLFAAVLLMPVPAGAESGTAPGEIIYEAPALKRETPYGFPDGDSLFAGYFNEQFYGRKSTSGGRRKAAQQPAGNRLTGNNKAVYDEVKAQIAAVADGSESRTDFEVEIEIPELKEYYSAAELGVAAVVENGQITNAAGNAAFALREELAGIDFDRILNALLADCPYELYWFDKTEGYAHGFGSSIGASYVSGEYRIRFKKPHVYCVYLTVAGAYADKEELVYDEDEEEWVQDPYAADKQKTSLTKTAAANARAEAARYGSLTDPEKLKKYKEYICRNVSYNDEAADDENDTPYGDPWQMIWVFDEDPDTNVVCEGYSKAFQYLCDQTVFNAKVVCRTMTGTTGGNHMWNVIRIGGQNYLVDITNADTGDPASDSVFFLAGKAGNTASTYTIGGVTYRYDSDTMSLYDEGERTLSGTSFNRNTYVPDLDAVEGVAATCMEDGRQTYYTYPGSERWFAEKDESTLIEDHGSVVISATGHHTPAEAVTENEHAATCAAQGSYDSVVYCSVCNTELSRETVYTEKSEVHTPAAAVTENEHAATCAAQGSYESVVYCSVCNKELSRETVQTEKSNVHTPSAAVTENEHAATCAAQGSYESVIYCSVCNAELSRETVQTEKSNVHTPSAAVTENEHAATCGADGSYDNVVYCEVCGDELSRETKFTPKTGKHTPADAVTENETAATCIAGGSYDNVVYCAVCGDELSRKTVLIPKTNAHTPAAVKEHETAATCAKEGHYENAVYCLVCGNELSRETLSIPKTNAHTPKAAVKENETAVTCTGQGGYDDVVYCSVCSLELSRNHQTLPPVGHSFAAWKYLDGSLHERTCSRDASHRETAAHTWDAGFVTTAPSTSKTGVKTFTCTVCGGTRTESVAKLAENEVPTPENAPTLDESAGEMLSMSGDEAPASARFGILKLRVAKVTSTTVRLRWDKVDKASGYVIYGGPCGSKFRKIAAVKKGKTVTYTVKKLKKNKYYKFSIIATAKYNGKEKALAAGKTVHAATSGGKAGNWKTLTLTNIKKGRLTLKKNQKYTIKTKTAKAKNVKVSTHRKICFESTDSKTASVSRAGVVKAKRAGKCRIFVYVQNGLYKTVDVTVRAR